MGIDTGRNGDDFTKTATTSEIRRKFRKMFDLISSIRRAIR